MALSPATLTVMLDAAWRVTLVLAVAWGATRLLHRHPAALRHAVWATALVAALAVPMLGGVLPSWRVAVLPAAASAPAIVPSSPNVPPSRPIPRPAVSAATVHALRGAHPGDMPTGGAAETPMAQAVPSRSAADWLGLLWATVAAMILGRYGASVASVRWLTRDAQRVTDARWRDATDVASAELGLAEPPVLLASESVTVPFTSGVLRPVVVVPASALSTWSDQRIRVVLLHELAHVRRRDCLVQAMSQVACAAYWFNPLTWVAARRLRAERERACDDLVLDAGLRAADYAQHLLDIARTVTSRRSLSAAALAMARPSELEGRLLAILDGHRARRMAGARLSWRMAAALVAVVVPVASVQPVAREVSVIADHLEAIAGQSSPAPTPTPAPAPAPTPAPVRAPVAVAQASAPIAKSPAPKASAQARPVSPAVIAGLTEAMKDPDPDVRSQAMQALTRLGAPLAYETLVLALKDEDADMRQQAAFSLGRMRDARAIDPLSAALKDVDPDVRQQAAFGLAQLKAVQAVPALQAALKDSDEDVRQQALFALSQIGDRSAVPAFIQALNDSNEDVRQQALFALSRLGDSRAVAAIIPLLSGDKSDDVRQQAAFALSRIGDERAIAALTAALKDPSPDVRRQAIFALSQLADGNNDDRRPQNRDMTPSAPAPLPAPAAPAPVPR